MRIIRFCDYENCGTKFLGHSRARYCRKHRDIAIIENHRIRERNRYIRVKRKVINFYDQENLEYNQDPNMVNCIYL